MLAAQRKAILRFLRRPRAVLLVAVLACVCIPAIVAAVFSASYWGYILRPPGVHPSVLSARELRAHSITLNRGPGEWWNDSRKVHVKKFAWRRHGYGAWRLLPSAVDENAWEVDWLWRGVIPSDLHVPEIASERLAQLPQLIEATAELERRKYGSGFPGGAQINAYELIGPQNEPLLFVTLSTGELSNDHRAYYELLYDDSVSPPRLIDRRRWFFDVAGIEGFEFVAAWMLLATLVFVCVMPPTIGVLLFHRLSRRGRIKRGHCAKCDYDLRHQFERGCPECGWKRDAGQVNA